MPSAACTECGAATRESADGCAGRFRVLLALDHSHRAPWGPRHGLAFAAFVLQHPRAHEEALDTAWATLHRIYAVGEAPAVVFGALVAGRGAVPTYWETPSRPLAPIQPFDVTIADLGDVDAATDAERLDAWCRATWAAWRGEEPAALALRDAEASRVGRMRAWVSARR